MIDDRLPVDRHYNPLCSHTKSKTHFECWVPLIEKAYMKLMSGKNGYGFIGSNSGFDLFSLTGWLPERVFFSPTNNAKKIKDHETTSERVWERLRSSHKFGDSLMTAAVSDSISDEQADSVGLFTGHAYAILNIKQVSEPPRNKWLYANSIDVSEFAKKNIYQPVNALHTFFARAGSKSAFRANEESMGVQTLGWAVLVC